MGDEALEIDDPERGGMASAVEVEIPPDPQDIRFLGARAQPFGLDALAQAPEDVIGIEGRLRGSAHELEPGPVVGAARHASEEPLEERAWG